MNYSPADITCRFLVAEGVGTLPTANGAWPIYIADEPDLPDNCITVYDLQGQNNGRNMPGRTTFRHQGIQVRVRSTVHTVGWDKAEEIREALHNAYDEILTISADSYIIHCYSKLSDVLALGKESPTSKRRLFTVNALISVKPYTITEEGTGTGSGTGSGTTTDLTAYEILDENGDAILDENGLSIYDEFYV